MYVAAAAYDTHAVGPATLVDDTGRIRIGRDWVRDADHKAMGEIPFDPRIVFG